MGVEERLAAASRPGPRPAGRFGEGCGALQDTAPGLFPGPLSTPAGLRPGELEGPRKKAGSCLLPHSLPGDHTFTDLWQNEGLTTNQLIGSWLLVGGAWCQPMAEQEHEGSPSDHCLVTGTGGG